MKYQYVPNNEVYVHMSEDVLAKDVLNQVFATFKVNAEVFHNGQYCGNWAIDTSGKHYLSFHLITHGKCYLMVNGNRELIVALKQGDFVLFPHDAKHCISSEPSFQSEINVSQSEGFDNGLQKDSTGLICGYFVHQHPLIKQMTEYLPESIVVNNNEQTSSALSQLVKLLIEESLSNDKGSSFLLEKFSECILALLLREHLNLDKGLFAGLANVKLNSAISAIINRPELKWNLDSLASESHMSRSSFSDLFKTVVGLPVMEFLTQWRISLAYRLLKDQGLSTLATAIKVGYDNESSFSKAFKRVLGISPGAVRTK